MMRATVRDWLSFFWFPEYQASHLPLRSLVQVRQETCSLASVVNSHTASRHTWSGKPLPKANEFTEYTSTPCFRPPFAMQVALS